MHAKENVISKKRRHGLFALKAQYVGYSGDSDEYSALVE
jgi:hypothetical protein